MVHYINFTDPNSGEMTRVLESIPTCPGVCIFMDINKSTDMKYEGGLKDWGRKLNNTFNVLLRANHLEDNLVKGIGDEMMLYITEVDLGQKTSDGNCFGLLSNIYDSLSVIRNHPVPGLFLNCKVALHFCTEVHNITFFEGANDYYGSDIDLTARLMSKSIENRIVLSEKFYDKVLNDMVMLGISHDTGCLKDVSGPFTETFRGVPVPTTFRVLDVD
jgi:hypothetical protein